MKTTYILPILFLSAAAAPTSFLGSFNLFRRQAPETVILGHCDASGQPQLTGSYFDYYSPGHDANGQPDDRCRVSDNIISWENATLSCTYPSGVTFFSIIQADAQNQTNFSVVGTGWNTFRQFACRKDNKREYLGSRTTSCRSIYYCQVN